MDPRSPTLCFLAPIFLDLLAAFQASTTACCNGIQPPSSLPPLTGRPRGAKSGARMAGVGVCQLVAVRHPPAHQPYWTFLK
jgi:hypothetical protein